MRLLIDPPLDGATNMARDEALLALHAPGTTPPTLRLYRWEKACLSLGRFQRSGEIDRARCEATGVDVVRRPSGGRALLHDFELTYAVVTGDDSLLGGSIRESYRRISVGVLAGLARLGVEAMLEPVRRTTNYQRPMTDTPEFDRFADGEQIGRRSSVVGHSAACYDTSVAYELTVRGRKLVGSAQTRQGGALLQHGAVPFVPHADQVCALLRRPPVNLAERMVALAEVLSRDVSFDEVADALAAGCAEAWETPIQPGGWTREELLLAEKLRATKYTTEWAWSR